MHVCLYACVCVSVCAQIILHSTKLTVIKLHTGNYRAGAENLLLHTLQVLCMHTRKGIAQIAWTYNTCIYVYMTRQRYTPRTAFSF